MKGISILAVAAFGLLSCDEEPVMPSSRDSALRPTFAPSSRGVTIRDLGTLGGVSSSAYAIDDNEEVVGASDGQGFFWSAGGMQSLATSTSSGAKNLNSLQQVVGSVFVPRGSSLGDNHAALFTRDPDGTWK